MVDCVATDSGGIQEEAVSLGKPVIVLREKSERMEGVWEGCATLVGTDPEQFIKKLTFYLKQESSLIVRKAIYGDGYAAEKIVCIIKKFLEEHLLLHTVPQTQVQLR